MSEIDMAPSTTRLSNLIIPMIIERTGQNYSPFIAYVLWRIPQIMETIAQEYNDGARVPDDLDLLEPDEPEEPSEPEPEFDELIVTDYALTVRNGPAQRFYAIRYLRRGTMVEVYEIIEGWARISPDKQEWCSTTRLKSL